MDLESSSSSSIIICHLLSFGGAHSWTPPSPFVLSRVQSLVSLSSSLVHRHSLICTHSERQPAQPQALRLSPRPCSRSKRTGPTRAARRRITALTGPNALQRHDMSRAFGAWTRGTTSQPDYLGDRCIRLLACVHRSTPEHLLLSTFITDTTTTTTTMKVLVLGASGKPS